MTKIKELIPTAPFRILEAVWYQSILGAINENEFQFPYINEAEIDLSDELKLQKKLIRLSGSELAFELSDFEGHRAEILLQATPVKKNESQISYELINSNLNGTTPKVLSWLNDSIEEVRKHYEEVRKSA